MAKGDAWIAVDWGTTNRRAYLIGADDGVVDTLSDDRGILTVADGGYPDAIADLRARFGAHRVVAAGMVGSNRGWAIVPYVDAPASLDAVAAAAQEVAPEVWIAPGVALRAPGRADVMRGEEVQVLGAMAAGMAADGALFCQPGTHGKWIAVDGGCIVDFSTSMTGELFALVRRHGILAGMLDDAVTVGPAFRAGVERGAGAVGLSAALFQVRASVLLGTMPATDAASYASGVLIGADVGAQPIGEREVALLASGPLADLYAAAIGMRGGIVRPLDSHAGFLAGIRAVAARL